MLIGGNKIINLATELDELVEAEVNTLGFDFIGLEFDRHVTPNVLRVYADLKLTKVSDVTEINNVTLDPPKLRGITIEECSKISYYLNKVLSVNSNLNIRKYVLEVSSPGIERRLFNLSQYEKYLGKTIKLRLYKAIDNKRNVIGVLQSVDKELKRILLKVEGQDLSFYFDDIAKANLIYSKS